MNFNPEDRPLTDNAGGGMAKKYQDLQKLMRKDADLSKQAILEVMRGKGKPISQQLIDAKKANDDEALKLIRKLFPPMPEA